MANEQCKRCNGSGFYLIDPGTLETGPQEIIEETCECVETIAECKHCKGMGCYECCVDLVDFF